MSSVTHVVLFNLGEEYSLTEETSNEGCKMLLEIPGVLSSQFGKTFTTDRAAGNTHVLVVTFDSKESLENYSPHEKHVQFAEKYIRPFKQGAVGVDIDTETHAKM